MQTVLRHSGRLCTRVSKRRIQRFSCATTLRSDDPRPEDRDTTQKHDPSIKTTPTKEQDVTEDVTDNGEVRRGGFRRTLRQRRRVDIPKPPALPAWFFRRNVKLLVRDDDKVSTERKEIECVDIDSGKTWFTMSCRPEAAALLLRDRNGEAAAADDHSSSAREDKSRLENVIPLGISPPSPEVDRAQAGTQAAQATSTEAAAIISANFALAGRYLPTTLASRSELSLETLQPQGHQFMDRYVEELARTVNADVVRLDANDIADLTEDYVGQGSDAPGTFSTLAHDVFDGRVSQAGLAGLSNMFPRLEPFNEQKDEENEEEEEEEDEEGEEDQSEADGLEGKANVGIKELMQGFRIHRDGAFPASATLGFAIPAGLITAPGLRPRRKRFSSSSDYVQWDDARLSAVLEQVIDAPRQMRNGGTNHGTPDWDRPLTDHLLPKLLMQLSRRASETVAFQDAPSMHSATTDTVPGTIVHVKDLNDIYQSRLGEKIITRLAKVVQKRRRLGEKVMVIGTSTNADGSISEPDDTPFITLRVPSQTQIMDLDNASPRSFLTPSSDSGYHRIKEINMRNIVSTLRRTYPERAIDQLLEMSQDKMFTADNNMLGVRILSQETVHRIVLTAIGLAQTHVFSETVQAIHIALAIEVLDIAKTHLPQPAMAIPLPDSIRKRLGQGFDRLAPGDPGRQRLDEIKKGCNRHETKLLSGVVDAQNIKTGFDDVHVAPDTIEALRTLTTLSLLRPDAFKYGVLAKDNLSGLMLYGPPGTGKTLLAKAVAKESKATVLEVSGAQVYEKYVGEGEKMVRAVFTLAKKLTPCVVFIDEADALFGTRNSASNRSTHRELINQFLREWDGMDDHKVFIMVATNRPFDLDDAVLRRLPRKLLVDLPVAKDRESILGIHLRDEALDAAVSIPTLAEQTPLYSGSDLKNLCVAAALAAVREENELAAQHADDKDFALPEKRTLQKRHFEKGLQEISASISEDMSSLTAIRKFDEQYGDRKGRRKKASYGFGGTDIAVDENAARVRQ